MNNSIFEEYEKEAAVFAITPPPAFVYDLFHLKRKRYGPTVEVRTEPKIGRNAPCKCGSGVKYKKCCGKA